MFAKLRRRALRASERLEQTTKAETLESGSTINPARRSGLSIQPPAKAAKGALYKELARAQGKFRSELGCILEFCSRALAMRIASTLGDAKFEGSVA